MHFLKSLSVLIAMLLLVSGVSAQDEKVYSGPQAGETLPEFTMKLGFGEKSGQTVDLVKQAGENPVVLIFVHKRSRPAFALANSVMKYCNREGGDKLTRGICFLTADPTETQTWMSRIKNYFPKGIPVGFSGEGIEGPGQLGLNRNVELTVLVAKSKKVTANFALVQPGAHADGPKILAAIAEATGAKGKPDINQYLPSNQAAQDAPIAIDPGLMKQIRVINAKDATPAAVGEGIAEIEKMIKDNKALQNQLGTIVVRWKNTKRIEKIGNQEQQKILTQWATDFAPKMRRRMNQKGSDQPRGDSGLTELLRSVIQKTNSNEQVDAAVKAVDQYVAKNPAAAKELARITATVTGSDKLSNYGTPYAQEKLKAWAKKYQGDKR